MGFFGSDLCYAWCISVGQFQLSGLVPRPAIAARAEITHALLMDPEWIMTISKRDVFVTRNVSLWATAASTIHRRAQVISYQNMLPSNL